MRTQYYAARSPGGFIATEDDSLAWLFSLGDLEHAGDPAFISKVGALAMGSATWERARANSCSPAGSRALPRNDGAASCSLQVPSGKLQRLPDHL